MWSTIDAAIGFARVPTWTCTDAVCLCERRGTAVVLPDDDAHRRLRGLPWFNSTMVRLLGTHLTTVRIDLDPAPET